MLLAGAKCGPDERVEWIEGFALSIQNWAVCDTLGMDLKCARKQPEPFWALAMRLLQSDQEFVIRLGVVILLAHFLDDEHIDRVLDALKRVRHEGYYVKMAVAWAYSGCFIRYAHRTMPIFEQGLIDDKFTHNKAIQKTIESFRVEDEIKQKLRALRRR